MNFLGIVQSLKEKGPKKLCKRTKLILPRAEISPWRGKDNIKFHMDPSRTKKNILKIRETKYRLEEHTPINADRSGHHSSTSWEVERTRGNIIRGEGKDVGYHGVPLGNP